MRNLHNSADELLRYVQSLGLSVIRCDRNKKSLPVAEDTSAIEEMLQRSEKLRGSVLPYYLGVSKSIEAEALPLKDAVLKIEASPANNHFLVVGYEDGGVISVSGTTLPFQINARPADWWIDKA